MYLVGSYGEISVHLPNILINPILHQRLCRIIYANTPLLYAFIQGKSAAHFLIMRTATSEPFVHSYKQVILHMPACNECMHAKHCFPYNVHTTCVLTIEKHTEAL